MTRADELLLRLVAAISRYYYARQRHKRVSHIPLRNAINEAEYYLSQKDLHWQEVDL